MNKKIYLFIVLLVSIFTININVYAEDTNVTETTNTAETSNPEVTTTTEDNKEVTTTTDKQECETCKEKQGVFEYTNKETNFRAIIEDKAELLTREEKEKLFDQMQPLTEYGHIVFLTITENDYSPDTYAKNNYYERFGNESGTLFLIDMKNRYLYIVSGGWNYKYVTRHKADIITDNVYMDARNERWFDCASKAFTQIGDVLEGNKIMEPMRYVSNIVLSILIAFSLCYLYVLIKTDVAKATSEEVLKNCNIDVKVTNVHGDKTGTKKVYSPVSSDSGGGSSGFSGGSSGGGGFSGGGGGGFSGGGGGHGF